jgi:hypothetical protein
MIGNTARVSAARDVQLHRINAVAGSQFGQLLNAPSRRHHDFAAREHRLGQRPTEAAGAPGDQPDPVLAHPPDHATAR